MGCGNTTPTPTQITWLKINKAIVLNLEGVEQYGLTDS